MNVLNEHGEVGMVAVVPSESEVHMQKLADGLQMRKPENPIVMYADNCCECCLKGDPANKGAGTNFWFFCGRSTVNYI